MDELDKKIENVMACEGVIISIVGPHAGEELVKIVERKQEDTRLPSKRTFWLVNSRNATPETVQEFCRATTNNGEVYCLLIKASNKGKGAKDTKDESKAHSFKEKKDGEWKELKEISDVTGRFNSNTAGLVFSELKFLGEEGKGPVDLNNYSIWVMDQKKINPNVGIKIKHGASTVCAICNHPSEPGMKSSRRNIVCLGKLAPPFAVWLSPEYPP